MNTEPETQPLLSRMEKMERELVNLRDRISSLEGKTGAPVSKDSKQTSKPAFPLQRDPEANFTLPGKQKPETVSAHPGISTKRGSAPLFPPSPKKVPRVRTFLKAIGLLPPEEGNVEIQLGSWGLPRIGISLAVIGVVFLGIYVTRHTSPLFRFVNLVGISLGTLILGHWMGRKWKRYGSVLFSGGLALLYYTVFAGYAVQPVKVINSPVLALLLQFVTVFFIVICALWKDSGSIASMALLLGFVSCGFSYYAGLNNHALVAALLLGVAASFLYLVKRWHIPFRIAVVFTYIIYGMILVGSWYRDGTPPPFLIAIGYPAVPMILYAMTGFAATRMRIPLPVKNRGWIQIVNVNLPVFLGFLATQLLFPGDLYTFYFLYGIILFVFAAIFYLSRQDAFLNQFYFAMGVSLLTLGFITKYGARQRWIVLALEGLILTILARGLRRGIVELASVVVIFASMLFFTGELMKIVQAGETAVLWSPAGITDLSCLVFLFVVFSLHARWFKKPILPYHERGNLPLSYDVRILVHFIYSLCLSWIILVFGWAYFETTGRPPAYGLLAALAMAISLFMGHWVTGAAGIVPLLIGHFQFVIDRSGPMEIYGNGTVLIIATIFTAYGLLVLDRKKGKDRGMGITPYLEGMLHILWMFSLHVIFRENSGTESFFLSGVLVSLLLGILSLRYSSPTLTDLSILPMVFTLWTVVTGKGMWRTEGVISSVCLWPAAGGAFVYAFLFEKIPRFREKIRIGKNRDVYQLVHFTVAILVGLVALDFEFSGENFMPALAVASLVTAILARRPGLKFALYGSMFYGFLSHWEFYRHVGRIELRGDLLFFMMSLSVSAITLAIGLMAHRLKPGMRDSSKRKIQWIHAAGALLFLFILFLYRQNGLSHYITVFWGISAMGIFLLGLLDRSRPYRVTGLVGMGICLPRAFLVDIQSTLYRIAAFLVLGIVFLLVGYLYTRFRDVLEKWREPQGIIKTRPATKRGEEGSG